MNINKNDRICAPDFVTYSMNKLDHIKCEDILADMTALKASRKWPEYFRYYQLSLWAQHIPKSIAFIGDI